VNKAITAYHISLVCILAVDMKHFIYISGLFNVAAEQVLLLRTKINLLLKFKSLSHFNKNTTFDKVLIV